ncbi:hypothetical protein ECANGB1_1984 [Enterospora canceri]|uniref:Uncharacterized protein n=1 Tax=Enterospora canceri TaxID=1081671 RepID=A0A1Y1S6D0_9MICR|nr:hypothetical protein ECANGB1_1984 [Enterospora canceri]
MARSKSNKTTESGGKIEITKTELGIGAIRETETSSQRVRELEDHIASQNVVIHSLVEQIKQLQGSKQVRTTPIYSHVDEIVDLPGISKKLKKEESKEEKMSTNSSSNTKNEEAKTPVQNKAKRKGTKAVEEEEKKPTQFEELGIQDITKELTECFREKTKRTDFKDCCPIASFIEYAATSYEFKLENRKTHTIKNPMRMYIVSNLDGILYYIMQNINKLTLNEICSTIFYINCEIEPKQKMVIALDVIMYLKERSKMVYIISALYNNVFNSKVGEETIYKTICSICSILQHQYYIETELYKNTPVMAYLNSIKTNFGVFKASENLYDLLDELLKDGPEKSVLNFDKGRINNSCEIRGWCIRAICHVLDWDYTHNTVLVEKLKYKENPYHTLIAIYLAIDAFEKFGYDASVRTLTTELIFVMNGTSEIALLTYIFIREINTEKAEEYMEFYKSRIGLEKVYKLQKMCIF